MYAGSQEMHIPFGKYGATVGAWFASGFIDLCLY